MIEDSRTTEQFSITLPKPLGNTVRELCKAEKRSSVSNMIAALVAEAIEKRG